MTASSASESPTTTISNAWSSVVDRLRWVYRGAIHNESESEISMLQPRTSVGYALIVVGWPISLVLGYLTAQPEWVSGSLRFALTVLYAVSSITLYTGAILVLFSGIDYIMQK